ncbi:NifB/NifX family molybdenum-iron cluster-binding protein [Candidatus Omnitrophota bacterium]
MNICVTAQGNTLDAEIDSRFGRCQYFIIVDSDTLDHEVIENKNVAAGGAGIQAGQLMCDKGVDVVLTGNVGPNAFQTLQAANIKVITGVSGNIRKVLEKYENNELTSPIEKPSVDSHFGQQ